MSLYSRGASRGARRLEGESIGGLGLRPCELEMRRPVDSQVPQRPTDFENSLA